MNSDGWYLSLEQTLASVPPRRTDFLPLKNNLSTCSFSSQKQFQENNLFLSSLILQLCVYHLYHVYEYGMSGF